MFPDISKLYRNHIPKRIASEDPLGSYARILFRVMDTNTNPEVLGVFAKRIQRCYGCFIAYHLKDMYLGEDVTFFCENCKDDTMFHFNDFSKLMDMSKLKEAADDDHHH